jgi:peroxiredoxin
MTGRTKIGVFISIVLIAALGYGYLADTNPDNMVGQENDKSKKDEEKYYKAPDFTLKNIDGKDISLSDYKGKVVFINFWATWCGPCRHEVPAFIELQEEFGKDKLVILGISLDQGDLSVVEDFVDEFKINYEVLYGTQQVVAAYGGIQSIPTTFVIDGDGNIRDGGVGFPGKDYFKKVVEALL